MSRKVNLLLQLFGGPYRNYCTYYDDPYESNDVSYISDCAVSIYRDRHIIKTGERCIYCGRLIRWAV